jgi:hypothetical protein
MFASAGNPNKPTFVPPQGLILVSSNYIIYGSSGFNKYLCPDLTFGYLLRE